jgi:hypothetical protein
MSEFDRYLELKVAGASHPLVSLGASLEPLENIQSGLADRARRYVMDGANPEVLLELPKHREAAEWLGSPTSVWFGGLTRHRNVPAAVARRSWLDRQSCYLQIEWDGEALAQIERVGRLLAAVSSTSSSGEVFPDWLRLLLQDGFTTQRVDPSGIPKTIHVLSRLVIHAGGGLVQLLKLLFESEALVDPIVFLGCSGYRYRTVPCVAGIPDFFSVRVDDLAAALPELSGIGRQVFARTLEIATFSPNHNQTWRAFLLAKLAVDDHKSVRECSRPALSQLDGTLRVTALRSIVSGGHRPAERVRAIELLGVEKSPVVRDWLRAIRSVETHRLAIKALDQVLQGDETTLASIRAAVPEPPPHAALVDGGLGADAVEILQQNLQALISVAEQDLARESTVPQAQNNTVQGVGFRSAMASPATGRDRLQQLQRIDRNSLISLVQLLNGEQPLPDYRLDSELLAVLAYKGRIASRPDLGLLSILRYVILLGESAIWRARPFRAWLKSRKPDLREIGDALERLGLPQSHITTACMHSTFEEAALVDQLPPDRIWPWFAKNPEPIEHGLGVRPVPVGAESTDLAATLKILSCFPSVPAVWTAPLLQLAVGEARTHRAAARALLSSQPDIGAQVLKVAQGQKQDARQQALRWLAELDYREAIPTLRSMLVKETRELLRAELLSTLEAFGADLSAELASERLLAEAECWLSAGMPKELAWFDFNQMPTARWRDSSVVPSQILRAWVVLAVRLKVPAGTPLLSRYLNLLDAGSAAAFGRYLLGQFIAHDTIHPTLPEAQAYADANLDQRLASNLQLAKKYPELYPHEPTRERAHSELVQEKLGIYLGSAIGAKGMLGLMGRIPGAELVDIVQTYMRDNQSRRAQVEAMLESLSQSNDPVVIQFLLALSRRHRQASLQEKARALIGGIAERLDWTPEVLADRTVPTAGLDERGEAELSFGPRTFRLKLGADLKLALYAEDGKPLKALPEPRKDVSAGLASMAKAQFSASKKELVQVLSQQQDRLYEAMCAGRRWPLADWRQYLASHPIVGRLLQRLVWIAEADGRTWQFRPTEDGALLDTDDAELTLPAHAEISLAHAAVLPADAASRWLKHLKDFKIKPLFGQLDRPLPPTPAADAEWIDDRLGYCADAGGLGSALLKLGYQFASSGESVHRKSFASAGLRVVIDFQSGSKVVALGALSFETLGRGGPRILLAEVPRILLAEAVADYHQAASIGAFDPQWEQRVAW